MSCRAWASIPLLTVASTVVGCASSLDFDRVASGRGGPDAAVHDLDAGRVETSARVMIDALPGSSMPSAPEDAGAIVANRPAAQAGSSLADASVPVWSADAGSSRAESSGTIGDAEAQADAASDAAAAADSSSFSCATVSPKPYFCDDFETLALSNHWSEVRVYPTDPLPGGTLEIDGSAARAGRYSLLADVHEGLSPCANCIELRAGLTLPNLQGPMKLTAELDVRVEQIDANDNRRVALLHVWWGTPELGFTQHMLQLASGGGFIWTALAEAKIEPRPTDDSDAKEVWNVHQWEKTPMLSEWVHVVYTLDVQDALGTANMARLTVGDVVLYDGPLSYPLRKDRAVLEIGVPWLDVQEFGAQETSHPWRIRYDNVLVRYEPRE